MTDATQLAVLAQALPYGSCPLDGVATAGQPNAAQLAMLAQAGYRAIVDLRAAEEPRGFDEAAAIEGSGMRYVRLPVTHLTLGDNDFDRMRELLNDPMNRPMLVHCASANRVGALMIPYFVLDEGREMREAIFLAGTIGLRSGELARMAADYVRRHARG